MEKEMTELEQMRDTLRLFKEELAKQKIVNERLLTESMKHKMQKTNGSIILDIEELVEGK